MRSIKEIQKNTASYICGELHMRFVFFSQLCDLGFLFRSSCADLIDSSALNEIFFFFFYFFDVFQRLLMTLEIRRVQKDGFLMFISRVLNDN